jgi:hypothetical protein
LQNNTKYPNFIKVDVEGFEYNVIVGAKGTIEKYKPNFMIEIQKDEKEIISYFLSVEYNIFNDNWIKISSWNDFLEFKTPNIFFVNNSAL